MLILFFNIFIFIFFFLQQLKQRFWTEIYDGAKLFYLSGLINNRYSKMEVQNLARFISVMKFRPLIWRNTHPYVFADRMEDLTPVEQIRADPKTDRKISLYGYVRGTNFKQGLKVHIAGMGDFSLVDASFLPDPCPLPDKVKVKTLNAKQRMLYAPMADIGDIVYDKDAVYIEVPGVYSKQAAKAAAPDSADGEDEDGPEHEQDEDGQLPDMKRSEGDRMVLDLQDSQFNLTDQLKQSQVRLFSGSAPIGSQDVLSDGRVRRRVLFGDGEDDDENGDDDDDEGDEGDEEVDDEEDDDMDLGDDEGDDEDEMEEEDEEDAPRPKRKAGSALVIKK